MAWPPRYEVRRIKNPTHCTQMPSQWRVARSKTAHMGQFLAWLRGAVGAFGCCAQEFFNHLTSYHPSGCCTAGPGAAAPQFWAGANAFGWGERHAQAAVLRGAARNATRSRASGAGRARTGSCAVRHPRLPPDVRAARCLAERLLPEAAGCRCWIPARVRASSWRLHALRPDPAAWRMRRECGSGPSAIPRSSPGLCRLAACRAAGAAGGRRGAAWRAGPQGEMRAFKLLQASARQLPRLKTPRAVPRTISHREGSVPGATGTLQLQAGGPPSRSRPSKILA